MNAKEISKHLKRIYFIQLIPAVVLIGLLYFFSDYLKWQGAFPVQGKLFNDILVALTAFVGVAFPMFYRSYFVFRVRDKKEISMDVFVSFEKALMVFSLITPYFLVLSIAFDLKNKVNIFITILALYAAYYYFPSVRKMRFEMKIFRLTPPEEKNNEP